MAEKASVLVVANRTAESPELLSALRARHQEGSAEFTLLVPATPQGVSWAADMHSGGAAADEHLEHLADNLRREGLEVTGAIVGDGGRAGRGVRRLPRGQLRRGDRLHAAACGCRSG